MAYNFPSSPILNQTYSFNGKTWKWNGYAWDLLQAVFPAASGNNSLILASDGVNYVFVSAPPSSDLYARDTANNAANVSVLAYNTANNASNVAALAYDTANAKVSKAGDTMSGALIASALTANSTVTINTSSSQGATTIVTSSTGQIALDSFSTSAFRSAKYFVQMTSGTAYHIIELNLVHDDTTAYLAQYGEIKTGSELGVFDATITTGTLNLLLTPNNAITTIKASFTKLAV